VRVPGEGHEDIRKHQQQDRLHHHRHAVSPATINDRA
jgi:hypothetical protein